MNYDYICICGKRDTNEDRVLINDFMIMVLDGHGFRKTNSFKFHVVDLIIEHLPKLLKERIELLKSSADVEDIINLIKDCCLDVDMFIYNKYPDVIGGSTMTGLIFIREKIFIVNIGDSETVVFNGIVPIAITKKHKPTNKDELARIIDRGAFVAYNRVNGSLDISRTFGDYDYGKINLDKSFNKFSPIWAMADIFQLTEKYTNIFLYSDGFGDYADLATLVAVAFSNGEDTMSVKLANAVIKHSKDNITVISFRPK